MAVTKRQFKTDLKAKNLDYINTFFDFKHTPQILTDSFSYNSYNALKDVRDVKTNNYSNLFLTKKQLNTEWIGIHEKPKQTLDVVTTLSFVSNDPDYPLSPGIWLFFDQDYTQWNVTTHEVPYHLSYGKPEADTYQYFFNIEYVSDTECRISHNFGNLVYYLSVSDQRTIRFTIDYDHTCIFNYKLNEGQLQLFKSIITEKNGKKQGSIFTLGYRETTEGYAMSLSTDLTPSENNIFYINELQERLEIYLNNSYIGYDQSQYITSINADKSAFYIQSQALFHHQYSKDGEINFIPLKNSITYTGAYGRGDNMTQSYEEYPDTYFRTYNSISSGLNQEYGNDNIILNYIFTDQIYTVNDGDVIDFYIQLPEENHGMDPLSPYKQLNIADSKLVKNGAFASDVPYFADKVYKLQGENTLIYDSETGERLSPNNGVYLCSWLYQMNELNPPTWFDRYYYPDKVSRKEALTEPHYEESFNNVIDNAYDEDRVTTKIRENTYFDKVSDLVFEPGNHYKYARVSSTMVNEIVDNMSEYRVEDVSDQDGKLAYLSAPMSLDNKHYLKIDHKSFSNTNSINFNTDLYITNGEKIGIQIFGSDYLSGLNIQNRKDLTPYHYYATKEEIFLLNNKFEIRHSFNLYEKYHDTINKFILGDVFDDVVVVSNLYLYIFNYDLTLKSKIHFNDIKGIQDIKINGIKGNLFNYPYYKGEEKIDHTKSSAFKIIHSTTNAEVEEFNKENVHILFNSGELEKQYIETNISSLICDQNALLYHNNIYIPYNQNVLKIILLPDAEKDDFPESEMENYPCKIRVLDYDEYFCNYQRTTTMGSTVNEPTMRDGYVIVENKIKNLYVSNKGKLYAFNFDKIAISPDDDTMYGLYEWDKYSHAEGWYWLYNQSLTKLESVIDTSKFAEFGSEISIDKIKLNEMGWMCLVRGFAEMSDERRFDIYDRSKRRFYRYSLSEFEEVYSLDTYRYINDSLEEQTVFTLIVRRTDSLYKIEYNCDTRSVTTLRLEDLPVAKNERFYETTNSNVILKYTNTNKLYFNLFLPNNYIYDYKETIEWDLTDIETGWYNINIYINLDEAKFEVKINDIRFADRNDSDKFKPYVNSNGNVFDVTYFLGTIGKRYGTTMSRILFDTNHDPYACKNSKIENAKLYNKPLEYHEYQAMRLEGQKINTISVTLPCGMRPNIEEIIRYFKYVPPAAISNKVRINITGTGLTTKGEFEMLRKEILNTLAQEKDCLVDVNNIEFI